MIPIAFITDENFIMQTGVAICSLAKNRNPDTVYDVFVIMAECSEAGKEKLLLSKRNGVNIRVIETTLDCYRGIRQMSHIPISCLLKFNLCDLVTDYNKIIYLDGDICVRGDLTDLYQTDLGEYYMAGVPSLDMVFDERKLINAGILLFDAKRMRESHMSEKLTEVRKNLGDRGSMDQQTFNMVMPDKIGILPCKYNCIPHKLLSIEGNSYPIEKLNALYDTHYLSRKEMVKDAVIIHYATGGKPWKYSYIECADEWYQYYLDSPYGTEKLKRKSAFRVHMEGIAKNAKKGGIKALGARIIWYLKALRGKQENEKWG